MNDDTSKWHLKPKSDLRAVARALYETDPEASYASVAKDAGVSLRTIKRWSADAGGWSKINGPEVARKAYEVADRIDSHLQKAGPSPSDIERQAAENDARQELAVDARGQVIRRHRDEWRVVRGLLNEAVAKRDREKSRLAESVARTLKLTQDGERRAWGLEVDDSDTNTILIDRGDDL
jgi:hypothetical protein